MLSPPWPRTSPHLAPSDPATADPYCPTPYSVFISLPSEGGYQGKGKVKSYRSYLFIRPLLPPAVVREPTSIYQRLPVPICPGDSDKVALLPGG